MLTREISVVLPEEHGRRLQDPSNTAIHHFEAYLPFMEAVKLERGNANVRPSKETLLPVRAMLETVLLAPEIFHLKNRGITYICDAFRYDNKAKALTVTIPAVTPELLHDDDTPRFGIADGGHTFQVIERTMAMPQESREVDPYVRVHFMAGDSSALGIEDVVEALNTSTQVKLFTLEEYRGKFDILKEALTRSDFDISQVAFRENENKEWQVTEIVQRLAMFLRDRWRVIPPASMYRSREKALQLFLANQNNEFTQLYPLIRDIVTLPEYVQAALGELADARRLGGVKGVRKHKKQFQRPGTPFMSSYSMDGAIVLPMASAFRVLLGFTDGKCFWKQPPHDVFAKCAPDLYSVLLARIRRVKSAGQLANDQEYWLSCEKVVLNARSD